MGISFYHLVAFSPPDGGDTSLPSSRCSLRNQLLPHETALLLIGLPPLLVRRIIIPHHHQEATFGHCDVRSCRKARCRRFGDNVVNKTSGDFTSQLP
jgi:hypothetical protein